MEEYDFLVIGTGSGLDVANVAVNQELSVAIAEKGPLGGTRLNRGCIPSKMLLYHADVMETIEGADEFGIHAEVDEVEFADIVREVNEEVSADADSIRRGIRSSDHHELYEGEAQFVDDRTVEISGGADDGVLLRAETVRSPDGAATTDEADRVEVEGETLLLATGRAPNSETLNLGATGVETDDRGFVETNEYLRTTAEGVWALGDIVGEHLLKHNANHEARAVVGNLFGDELDPVDYSAMPFAVFASLEVAGVGAREEELQATGVDYATRTYPYEETARGDAMNAEGLLKVIIDLEGEILGCHIVGPDASNLVEEVVVAMTAGSGAVRDIRQSVHIHPALAVPFERNPSSECRRRLGGIVALVLRLSPTSTGGGRCIGTAIRIRTRRSSRRRRPPATP